MFLFVKVKEGYFDVKEDFGRVTDIEISVGLGGVFRYRKRYCFEEGLFYFFLSLFGLFGLFFFLGWCELEGEFFVNEVKNKTVYFVRWLGLNF